jgi:hypothetical protein
VIAERDTKYGTSYRVRDGEEIVARLNFREVMALVAVLNGHVHWRWRRTYSPYLCDSWLGLECDVYGVGDLTLQTLTMKRWGDRDALVAPYSGDAARARYSKLDGDDDTAELTPLGAAVVEALLYLPGLEAAGAAAA